MPLPALPAGHWPAQFHAAYDKLVDAYGHGTRLLRLTDVDPIRLQVQFDRILGECKPLLEGLERSDVPRHWVTKCARKMARQAGKLMRAAEAARGVDHSATRDIQPTTEVYTGLPGRPRKVINTAWLRNAFGRHRALRRSTVAQLAGVSRHTLTARMKQAGIRRKYSDMTARELDDLVRHYKRRRPRAGYRYIIGSMRKIGVHIQRRRLLESMRRTDEIGYTLRRQRSIRRRQYKVSRPHALWHMDGHHKLIRWGIVIHGMVDGYTRVVTGIRASNNNRAETVMSLFKDSIKVYGCPSRMRGDRGRENTKVSVFMVMYRGARRASFIWGPSTRNTRIERLWGELGSQCLYQWRGFFLRLERLHCLDNENTAHLWLLHKLFLTAINVDCLNFQADWNHHPMTGPDMAGMSPADKLFVGQTQHGVYVEDCANVHPDVIQDHYGVFRGSRAQLEDSDVEDNVIEEIEEYLETEQERNVHADSIDAPDAKAPFADEDEYTQFLSVWRNVREGEHIPRGFGALEDEWEVDGYPPRESIPFGRRGKRMLDVELPHDIWYPRAILWVQALYALGRWENDRDEG